ncbi:MAG: aldo/keto reductase [Clostridia bacterium]
MRCPTVQLGRRGPIIPALIFGTEHIIHLTPEEGGRLLDEARRDFGLFHWDTAPPYGSQPHVAQGLKLAGREKVVVTSKIASKSYESARDDLLGILEELGSDYLDICFLHNVKAGAYREHMPALEFLCEAKEAGVIRHVGLSSHVPGVIATAATEERLQIVCAPLNLAGSRIDDGDADQMAGALRACHAAGKGVYVIKVLGVGDLSDDVPAAIDFALRQPFVDACNVGMRDMDQVAFNVAVVNETIGKKIS